MAHKLGSGSTKNNRDSKPKHLGLKCVVGHLIRSGSIIARQRGCQFKKADNVDLGKEYTLYALKDGIVK